ncbi:16719_t:CDS:2, partial [Acaulospora morrowiae]
SLDPEEFRVAEKKREEMIKSGISFVEKPGFEHPKSVYSSRTLDYLIKNSKVILYNLSNTREMSKHNYSNVSETLCETKREAEETDDFHEIVD